MIYVTHDQTEAMTMGDRIVIMKDGLVNQVDSPINLYNKPINHFVAGFIGSPAMNFIEGKISNDSYPKFVSNTGELVIPIDNMNKNELINYTGKNVIAGIRPEDIYTQQSDQTSSTTVKVNLDLIEQMGNEALAYFQIDENQFVARFPSSFSASPNADIQIFIDDSKIHFFDKESGNNLK